MECFAIPMTRELTHSVKPTLAKIHDHHIFLLNDARRFSNPNGRLTLPALDHQFAANYIRVHYSRASRPWTPSHRIYPLITLNESPHNSWDTAIRQARGETTNHLGSGPPGRTIEILIKQHELRTPKTRTESEAAAPTTSTNHSRGATGEMQGLAREALACSHLS